MVSSLSGQTLDPVWTRSQSKVGGVVREKNNAHRVQQCKRTHSVILYSCQLLWAKSKYNQCDPDINFPFFLNSCTDSEKLQSFYYPLCCHTHNPASSGLYRRHKFRSMAADTHVSYTGWWWPAAAPGRLLWGINTQLGTDVCFPQSVCLRRKTPALLLVRYFNEHKPPSRMKTTALAYLYPLPVQQITWIQVTSLHWPRLFCPHHNCDKIWCTWRKESWDLWWSLFTLRCSVCLFYWLMAASKGAVLRRPPPRPPALSP